MAIVVPILSEFNDRGIKNANKGFKDLQGFGQKASYAIRKAAIPATAAMAGLAAAAFDAAKGAIEDAEAADKLANQLRRSTKATDDQVQAVEDWISVQGQLLGITDDELRPALARLATVTGSITTSQEAATLAMDISAATGKDLSAVTEALAKAYGGNLTALQRLDPSLREIVKSGGDVDAVMTKLSDNFSGAATESANTIAGQMRRANVAFNETKEALGAMVVDAITPLLPLLQRFANWAQNNPETFRNIAIAIAAVTASIVALNLALAVNPIVLIAGAITGLAVVMALNWPKIKKWFEDFRAEIDRTLGPLDELVSLFFEGFGNALNLGDKLFGSSPMPNPKGRKAQVPGLADGGIVKARNGGTLALIGEGGRDEAVVPLSRGSSAFPTNGITINVSGALDPVAVGNQLREILRNQDARFGY